MPAGADGCGSGVDRPAEWETGGRTVRWTGASLLHAPVHRAARDAAGGAGLRLADLVAAGPGPGRQLPELGLYLRVAAVRRLRRLHVVATDPRRAERPTSRPVPPAAGRRRGGAGAPPARVGADRWPPQERGHRRRRPPSTRRPAAGASAFTEQTPEEAAALARYNRYLAELEAADAEHGAPETGDGDRRPGARAADREAVAVRSVPQGHHRRPGALPGDDLHRGLRPHRAGLRGRAAAGLGARRPGGQGGGHHPRLPLSASTCFPRPTWPAGPTGGWAASWPWCCPGSCRSWRSSSSTGCTGRCRPSGPSTPTAGVTELAGGGRGPSGDTGPGGVRPADQG